MHHKSALTVAGHMPRVILDPDISWPALRCPRPEQLERLHDTRLPAAIRPMHDRDLRESERLLCKRTEVMQCEGRNRRRCRKLRSISVVANEGLRTDPASVCAKRTEDV